MTQIGPSGRAIARIQRLCSLGLGGQVVIPQLMRELQDLVPSSGNAFFWAGPNLELANTYFDQPIMAELAPLYLGEFHNRRELEIMITFKDFVRNRYASPVAMLEERLLTVDHRDFVKSDMYNQILRPLQWDRTLVVKVTNHGHHLGALQIGRPVNAADFTRRDVRLLEAIAPFIAHALVDHGTEEPFVESDSRAMIIADARGCIQHLSQHAGWLLLMARFPSLSAEVAGRMRGYRLPDAVVQLCKALGAQGGNAFLSAPPVWRHRNPWGEFVFHAHAMEPDNITSPRLIGISIERREPLLLKLARGIDALPLSNRESQLCLALVTGQKRADIADKMGVSEHTVITHCRNLYAKLDVHTRGELAEKLRVM